MFSLKETEKHIMNLCRYIREYVYNKLQKTYDEILIYKHQDEIFYITE